MPRYLHKNSGSVCQASTPTPQPSAILLTILLTASLPFGAATINAQVIDDTVRRLSRHTGAIGQTVRGDRVLSFKTDLERVTRPDVRSRVGLRMMSRP